MSALKLAFARHYQIGSMTACGLRGIAHRALAATKDPDRVTCQRCRRSPLLLDPGTRPLSAIELAHRLGLHINTVKRLSPSDLPYFRVGPRGDRRYRVEDVEAYIDRRSERA